MQIKVLQQLVNSLALSKSNTQLALPYQVQINKVKNQIQALQVRLFG